MPTYAVDSGKQLMMATGLVEVMPEWEEKPGGGRKPSDRQARDEDTGMPLWGVEVMYQQSAWGRVSTVVAKVTVGSVDEPKPRALVPVAFEDLRVEVRTLKSGGLVENWSSTGLVKPAGGSSAGSEKSA